MADKSAPQLACPPTGLDGGPDLGSGPLAERAARPAEPRRRHLQLDLAHLRTQRLVTALEDLDALLRANSQQNIPEDDEAKFRTGIIFLAAASKKQLNKALSFDCSHLRGSPEEDPDEQLAHNT